MKTKTQLVGRNDNELYNKALKAYITKSKKEGLLYLQPSEFHSEVNEEVVKLRNGSDLLATYNHLKQRFE